MSVVGHLTRYSIRDLTARPTRTVLTILGIIIGIAFMVSLTSLTLSMKTRIKEDIESLLSSAILVSDTDLAPIPIYIADTMQQIAGVRSVVPVVIGGCIAMREPGILLGVPVSEILSFVPYPQGRLPSSDDVAEFITTDFGASSLRLKINGSLKVITQYMSAGLNMQLVGTTEIGGFFQGLAAGTGSVIVTGISNAQRMLNVRGYATYFIVRVSDVAVADQVIREIKATFPRTKVLTERDLLRNLGNIIDTLDALMFSVSLVSLAVSGLSIMNSIAMSVAEKRREIGVLKSIGADNWHVLYIFMLQGIILGAIGGMIGGAAGYALTYLLLKTFLPNFISIGLQFPFIFDLGAYFRGFSVALILSIVASIIPSWNATKVRPIESLRYE